MLWFPSEKEQTGSWIREWKGSTGGR